MKLILHLFRVMQKVSLAMVKRKRQFRIPTTHALPLRLRLPHQLVLLQHGVHRRHDLPLHHRRRHVHVDLRGNQLVIQRVPLLRLSSHALPHLERALDALPLLRENRLAVDDLRLNALRGNSNQLEPPTLSGPHASTDESCMYALSSSVYRRFMNVGMKLPTDSCPDEMPSNLPLSPHNFRHM